MIFYGYFIVLTPGKKAPKALREWMLSFFPHPGNDEARDGRWLFLVLNEAEASNEIGNVFLSRVKARLCLEIEYRMT